LQSIGSAYVIQLFALFTIVEYSFLCYFFYIAFANKPTIKKAIPYIWVAFFILALVDYFFINQFKKFDSFSVGLESIIIIIMAITYLFLQIKTVNNLLIYSTFKFWVAVTFLINFSGTFFLYLMTESMYQDPEFQKLYFIINLSFNILKNILLSVAMCMKTNNIAKTTSLPPDFLDKDYIFNRPTN